MLENDIDEYGKRVASFDWQVFKIPDGHDLKVTDRAFEMAINPGESAMSQKPTMIIAKTIKGKGFSIWEDKNDWHGRVLNPEQLETALQELGEVKKDYRGEVKSPTSVSLRAKQSNPVGKEIATSITSFSPRNDNVHYKKGDMVATRKAYGVGLNNLGKIYEDIVVLDGDVKNSTYTEIFAKNFPGRFIQCFIAEQNMTGMATGLAKLGFKPFVSTFSAFLTRAADQIRMAALANVSICFNGSHAGISIGQDGPSQMGLEDLSLFRSIIDSSVVYPADAVSTEKLLHLLYQTQGISYIRTTRPETPILYESSEEFPVGGSKVHKCQMSSIRQAQDRNVKCQITVIAAGITVHEALKAQEQLKDEQIAINVVDCYSIKPIDDETLKRFAANSKALITVEDHYAQGGLADAVLEALAKIAHPPVYSLAVKKIPRSGKPEELLAFEEIDAGAIISLVKNLV